MSELARRIGHLEARQDDHEPQPGPER
jgi:hypothetical protein